MKKILLMALLLTLGLTACKSDDDIEFQVETPNNSQNSGALQNPVEGQINVENLSPGQVTNNENSIEPIYLSSIREVSVTKNAYVENGEVYTQDWTYFEALHQTRGMTICFNYFQKYGMTKLIDVWPYREVKQTKTFPNEPDLIFVKYVPEGTAAIYWAIVDLKKGTAYDFPHNDAWRGTFIDEIELLPDMSLMYIRTFSSEGYEFYFYDGKNAINIKDLLAKVTEESFSSVSAYYIDDRILVVCSRGSAERNDMLYTFEYDVKNQTLIPCLEKLPEASTNAFTERIRVMEGYGIRDKDGYVTVVNLFTGRESVTDVPNSKMRYAMNFGGDYLVIVGYDQSVWVVNVANGRILAKHYISVFSVADDTLERIPSDKGIYIAIHKSNEGSKYIFELLEE